MLSIPSDTGSAWDSAEFLFWLTYEINTLDIINTNTGAAGSSAVFSEYKLYYSVICEVLIIDTQFH